MAATIYTTPEYRAEVERLFREAGRTAADYLKAFLMRPMTPLNNNVLIKKIAPEVKESVEGGIILPGGTLGVRDITEEAIVIAISPDLVLPMGDAPTHVKPGDRVLIHRGLNGTPIMHDGVEHMMIGYVNLIAKLT